MGDFNINVLQVLKRVTDTYEKEQEKKRSLEEKKKTWKDQISLLENDLKKKALTPNILLFFDYLKSVSGASDLLELFDFNIEKQKMFKDEQDGGGLSNKFINFIKKIIYKDKLYKFVSINNLKIYGVKMIDKNNDILKFSNEEYVYSPIFKFKIRDVYYCIYDYPLFTLKDLIKNNYTIELQDFVSQIVEQYTFIYKKIGMAIDLSDYKNVLFLKNNDNKYECKITSLSNDLCGNYKELQKLCLLCKNKKMLTIISNP